MMLNALAIDYITHHKSASRKLFSDGKLNTYYRTLATAHSGQSQKIQ